MATPNVSIEFDRTALNASEQAVVSEGFLAHSQECDAPEYRKEQIKWVASDDQNTVRAVLTADVLWDWMYVDELWVCSQARGSGLGRQLMQLAEEHAVADELQGIWLWTQSWQAEDFYRRLGYEVFTRFENFPRGHARIGYRKPLG